MAGQLFPGFFNVADPQANYLQGQRDTEKYNLNKQLQQKQLEDQKWDAAGYDKYMASHTNPTDQVYFSQNVPRGPGWQQAAIALAKKHGYTGDTDYASPGADENTKQQWTFLGKVLGSPGTIEAIPDIMKKYEENGGDFNRLSIGTMLKSLEGMKMQAPSVEAAGLRNTEQDKKMAMDYADTLLKGMKGSDPTTANQMGAMMIDGWQKAGLIPPDAQVNIDWAAAAKGGLTTAQLLSALQRGQQIATGRANAAAGGTPTGTMTPAGSLPALPGMPAIPIPSVPGRKNPVKPPGYQSLAAIAKTRVELLKTRAAASKLLAPKKTIIHGLQVTTPPDPAVAESAKATIAEVDRQLGELNNAGGGGSDAKSQRADIMRRGHARGWPPAKINDYMRSKGLL
jgi:hypothetical protein